MPNFPGSIYDPRTKENKPGTIYNPSNTTEAYAEDVVLLDDEVVAIEETLGENPQGDFDTVVDRLDDVDSELAGKQASLGFTPENVANKDTNVALGTDNTKYPSQGAVKSYVDSGLATKQASLGFTPENVANKDTNVALGTDNTKYPSQGAVKSYVDTGLATKQASLGFTPEDVANKGTTMSGNTGSNIIYLTAKAIYDWAVATFQAALGFTPEDVANKSTSTSLGTSDTLYPSQKAVKTYVDNNLGGTPGSLRKVVSAAATNVGSFSISSLDLDTDIAYELTVIVKLSSGGNNILLRMNGDSGGNYMYTRSDNGGSASPQQSVSSILLSPQTNSTTIQMFKVLITRCESGDMTEVFWSAASSTTSAGSNGDVAVGAGMYNSSMNITSIGISCGVNFDYRYFLNKLNA